MPATAVGSAKVHYCVEDLASGKFVAGEHPSGDDAKDAIDKGGGERNAEADVVRRHDARLGDGLEEMLPAPGKRLENQPAEGDQHEDAQIHDGVAKREPEARQNARSLGH
jgi:hypothetical protein